MGELLKRKLEALGYGGHGSLSMDESLVSRLVTDLIQASQAGEGLRKQQAASSLQLQLAQDKVQKCPRIVGKHAPIMFLAIRQIGSSRRPCMLRRHADKETSQRCPLSSVPAGRGADPRDATADDGEQQPAHAAHLRGRQARTLRAHNAASAQAPGAARLGCCVAAQGGGSAPRRPAAAEC